MTMIFVLMISGYALHLFMSVTVPNNFDLKNRKTKEQKILSFVNKYLITLASKLIRNIGKIQNRMHRILKS